MDISTRPRPIFAAFKSVGGALSALAGLVAYLGTYGILTTSQTAAASAALAAVPAAITIVGALLASFGVVKGSEDKVTPVSDPRMVVEGSLVRLIPALPAGSGGLTGGELPRD